MAWTRRRKVGTALLASILTVVVATLVVLLWVPISEENSGYTMIGTRLYTYESANLYGAPWVNVSYRGVLFVFPPPTCPQNAGGGTVCGYVLQSNGVNFTFEIQLPPPAPAPTGWITWVSPNQMEAIEIEGNSNTPAHLLVAA